MPRDAEVQKQFTRRALMLAAGKGVLMGVLAGRLYYLQVLKADEYATLADDNRINVRLRAPPRGRIVDRHGRPLAVNQQVYRLVFVAEHAPDPKATLRTLHGLIGADAEEVERVRRELNRRRKFVPVVIRESLEWDDVARIEVHAADLPGISIEAGQSRYYPFGRSLAHVLGYVAPAAEDDLTGDPVLALPGFRVGRAGIEGTYDRALRGGAGTSHVEINAAGRVIREIRREDAQPGSDVAVTLNLDLQQYAFERLGEESGAVAVMDVWSGDILALASSPAFDPNAFNRGLSGEEWRALISNPKAPLTNKAITGLFAPGSTFKPVVALAALEKGVITPQTTVACYGRTRLGRSTFHCWKRGGHGTMQLDSAIAQSCDVYFYEAARRTGIDTISEMANRFGLGERMGIGLPSEKAGLMPTRQWKADHVGVPWQIGETLVAGIGQGYVLTTPLQLAVMTARLANGGYAVTPRIVRDVVTEDAAAADTPAALPPVGIDSAHMAAIQQALDNVVNGRRGTAHGSAIDIEGYAMAGKTGTSQVRRITKAEREAGVIKNEDLPWERRDHALFIGYAPANKPRYAVAVVIEHGGGGSKAAAPVARDVLLAARHFENRLIARTEG